VPTCVFSRTGASYRFKIPPPLEARNLIPTYFLIIWEKIHRPLLSFLSFLAPFARQDHSFQDMSLWYCISFSDLSLRRFFLVNK